MSDDNSESTDSDNNNAGPFYNNYLRRLPPAPPYEHPESPDLEIEISSDSEYDVQLNNLETSSGEVRFLILIMNVVFLNFVLMF